MVCSKRRTERTSQPSCADFLKNNILDEALVSDGLISGWPMGDVSEEHASLQFGSFALLLFGSLSLAVLFGRLHPQRPVGNERSRTAPASVEGELRAKDCGCTLPSLGQLQAGEEGIRQRVLLETLEKLEGVRRRLAAASVDPLLWTPSGCCAGRGLLSHRARERRSMGGRRIAPRASSRRGVRSVSDTWRLGRGDARPDEKIRHHVRVPQHGKCARAGRGLHRWAGFARGGHVPTERLPLLTRAREADQGGRIGRVLSRLCPVWRTRTRAK